MKTPITADEARYDIAGRQFIPFHSKEYRELKQELARRDIKWDGICGGVASKKQHEIARREQAGNLSLLERRLME